jgi:hypothetical protein
MGYLNGLAKHDGTGKWGANDYGFWASVGDSSVIDGDVRYESGDWIVENDGSLLVKNSASQTIIRLGTDTMEKGLFIYDTTGIQLAKFISNRIFVGDLSKFFEYTKGGGLVLKAANFQIDPDGTMTATGGVFRTATSGTRVQIDSEGIKIVTSDTGGQYNTKKYNEIAYGSGVRAQIGSASRNVPIYFPSSTNYGDIHFGPKTGTPTGAAEADDCCAVNGVMYICTVAGTPGTWQKVGLQS